MLYMCSCLCKQNCRCVHTSRNSLRDFWQRCSWSSMVTKEFLMPALELRETTLLSLWMSDIMDLLYIQRKCSTCKHICCEHEKEFYSNRIVYNLTVKIKSNNDWNLKVNFKFNFSSTMHTNTDRVPKIFINSFEAGLFPGQRPSSKYRLQINPSSLYGIQAQQVLI